MAISEYATDREFGYPETCFEKRPMSKRKQSAWKRKYCQEQESILWTEKRIITPKLVPLAYGDGRQALALRPIITRLSHYVVAIDSRINIAHGHFHDMNDEVKDDIQELFGPCGCWECNQEGEYNVEEDHKLLFEQWPTPCFDGGCEWWVL